MDPDANLAEALRLVDRILADADARDSGSELCCNPSDGLRLAELFQALHGWIRNGGFYPKTWPTPAPPPNRLADVLEKTIDRDGLAHVVDVLADCCTEKAEHLAVYWQDDDQAGDWNHAAERLQDTIADLLSRNRTIFTK